MYEAFYNLGNDPFRLLPDPGICFPHKSCARAWAYLRYALKRGEGIVVVTGPPGSGKTTLAERLLTELNPAKIVSVRLIANDLNAADLLRKLAYSLGLPAEGMDRAMLAHRIERYLIELEHSHRRALVIIDEAQTLSHQALEAMRLLTDLQSRSRPVLQLILLGQEELEGVMSAPGMEQFQHRVIASCRLHTMDLAETKAYLEYRLAYADWQGDPSINGPAVLAIHRHSKGLPRHVNKICSRLLLYGSTEERHALNDRDVRAVVNDLREELLAPLGAAAEAQEDGAGGIFDSVYDLALVPARRDPDGVAGARREMDALSLKEEARPETRADATVAAATAESPWQGVAGRPEGRRQGHVAWHRPFRLRRLPRLLARLHAGRDGVMANLPSIMRRGRHLLTRGGTHAIAVLKAAARGVWRATGVVQSRLAAVVAGRRWGARETAFAAVGPLVLLVGIALLISGGGIDQRPGEKTAALLPATETPAVRELSILRHDQGYIGLVDTNPAEDPVRDLLTELPEGASQVGLQNAPLPPVGAALGGNGPKDIGAVEGELRRTFLGEVQGETSEQLLGEVTRSNGSEDLWVMAQVADIAPVSGPTPSNPEVEAEDAAGLAATGNRGGDGEAAAVDDADAGQTTLVARAGQEGHLDFVRLLPAPAAGRKVDQLLSRETAGSSSADIRADDVPVPGDSVDGPSMTTGSDEVAAVSPTGDDDIVEAEAEAEDLARLVALGDEALARDRLLLPEDESAHTYYRRALDMDPKNARALQGLGQIVDRYASLVRRALREEDFDKAERYAGRALRVSPADRDAQRLREEVAEARADAEAAAAALEAARLSRMAAEIPSPPEPVESKKPKLSSFDRLMRNVDGHPFRLDR